jgi:major membrane immunogen (membrane-anchored lipoprotein)
MKTLKITFLLLAVVLLTVSGQSSDTVTDTNEPTYKTQKQYDLMALSKKKAKLETNG